jgi:hypothetical protein
LAAEKSILFHKRMKDRYSLGNWDGVREFFRSSCLVWLALWLWGCGDTLTLVNGPGGGLDSLWSERLVELNAKHVSKVRGCD